MRHPNTIPLRVSTDSLGAVPVTVLQTRLPPDSSWWVGLERPAFQAEVAQQAPRQNGVYVRSVPGVVSAPALPPPAIAADGHLPRCRRTRARAVGASATRCDCGKDAVE
jgi:hypothetical protein